MPELKVLKVPIVIRQHRRGKNNIVNIVIDIIEGVRVLANITEKYEDLTSYKAPYFLTHV